MYQQISKGNDLDWEETPATRVKTNKRNYDYDSSDSERFNETLSDWDLDIKESIVTKKTTVRYTAPPKKKQAVNTKPDPEEYDDEYYEEEEDELVEIN